MSLVQPDSLAATVDAVDAAWFAGRPPSASERKEAAKWIAARQGGKGAYAGMFAPTDKDRAEGIRLFTGEAFRTRAGAAHVLGEEACRALILLDVPLAGVRDALARATAGIAERYRDCEKRERNAGRPWRGRYCCGKCSAALWRHLAAGGLEDRARHLAAVVAGLKAARTGDGRWRPFPFHYTLLALSEIDTPAAREEMRYAAPALQRSLRGKPRDEYARRRRTLAERARVRIEHE